MTQIAMCASQTLEHALSCSVIEILPTTEEIEAGLRDGKSSK